MLLLPLTDVALARQFVKGPCKQARLPHYHPLFADKCFAYRVGCTDWMHAGLFLLQLAANERLFTHFVAPLFHVAAGRSDAKGDRAANSDGSRGALAEHANSVRDFRPHEGRVERVMCSLGGLVRPD